MYIPLRFSPILHYSTTPTKIMTLLIPDVFDEISGSVAPAFVAQLTLTNFRNYEHLRLDLSGAPVVLVGANGAGKTNILEAISLLTPGRGLRHAKIAELDAASEDGPKPWAVAARLTGEDGPVVMGTGRDPADPTKDKRIAMIDGTKVRGMAELGEHLSALWLTPQQDQVLFEGSGARRRFLDRLVYGFDAEHAARVASYETAMSERNRLLKSGRGEPAWLDGLEQAMAERAVAIAAGRLEAVERIAHSLLEGPPEFPRARMEVAGLAERALEAGRSALEVETQLRDALREARGTDRFSGRSSVGTHRSEWRVWHPNGREAAQCSTGEQKAVLLSVLLAQARAAARWMKRVPLLLLDEVVAHLDESRRAALFEHIRDLRVQAWLTGTDAALFTPLLPQAQGFTVSGAELSPLS